MSFPTGYTKYQEITIDHTKVDADLTDYVVYVNLADLVKAGADIFDTCRTDGGDIRATKDDGTTQLATELVAIDTTAKTGELHIKFSGTLSGSTNTIIRIYYNGTDTALATSDTYGRDAVWSNYLAVWHLQEASGTRTGATGTNNLTDNNTVVSGTGKLGDGADFESGSNEHLSITDASQSGLDLSGDFSIQAWAKTESLPGIGAVWGFLAKDNLASARSYAIDLYNAAGSQKVRLFTSGNTTGTTFVESTWTKTLTTGTWFKLDFTYDISNSQATRGVLYSDGASLGNGSVAQSGSVTSIYNGNAQFILGNYDAGFTPYFDGLMDEVRITTAVLASTWLSTEYNNHNSSSTFYAAGNEVSGTVGVTVTPTVQGLTFSTPAYTIKGAARATINAQVATFTIPSYLALVGATVVQPATKSLTFSIPVYTAKIYALVMPNGQVLTYTIPAYTVVSEASITITPTTIALTFTTVSLQNVGAAWRKTSRNSSGVWTKLARNSD